MTEQDKQYSNMGLIVATGKNREIGCKKDLIWRIKEDLEFFKKVTMNSYIIMGRNTFESIPKNLPGRKYIVLSRDQDFSLETPKIVHRSIAETLAFVSQKNNSTFWIIGGGMIYANFLPYVNKMHITKINESYPAADTFFPEFNKDEWHEKADEELYCSENDVNYGHVLYLKK